jgi:hypothetical protein
MAHANIHGESFPNKGEFRIGRNHVARLDSTDAKDGLARFFVLSFTDPETVYSVEVSYRTIEVECGCKAGRTSRINQETRKLEEGFRETRRSPYSREKGGVYLEHLSRSKGYPLAPLITRQPRFLCKHARVVRRMLWRRGMKEFFLDQERYLTRVAEHMEPREKATCK